jgi:hypothetical protein
VTRPLGSDGLLAARVLNVVGRRVGAAGHGRLSLVSHYDSQPQTFGAGDAASGVATILETLRALGPDWRPESDVEVVITDGEELGLLGAEAFMESRRQAEGADLLLNFEARGQRGPVAMFETTAGNLGLVRLFAAVAPRPFASSLSYEVYRRMPNDTDFTVFRRADLQGLNFAFISGHPAYHSLLDEASRLSTGTLQQGGANTLALVRALTSGSVPEKTAGDAVYFNPWGTTFVLYPASWAGPLCGAIVVAVGALLALLQLRLGVRWGGAAAACALWFLGLAASSVVGWLFVRLLREAPGLLRSPHGEPYDFRAFVAVLALLVGAALIGVWSLRRTGVGAVEAMAGSLLFWTLLLLGLTWSVPGASYLAAWPIGFLGLGTVVVSLLPRSGPAAIVGMGLAALPGLAIWAPMTDLVFQALGLDAAPLLAPALAVAWSLLALPLWAVAGRRGGRSAGALTVVALAAAGALVLRDEPSSDRPGVDTLLWLQEVDGTARWFSLDASTDAWTDELVEGPAPLPAALASAAEGLAGPAALLELEPPRVDLLYDEARDGRRHLAVRLRSGRGAPVLRAFLQPGAPLAALRIGGREVPPAELSRGDLRLVLYGFGDEGAMLELVLDGGSRIDIDVVDQQYGLPEELLERPRPPQLIPAPGWLTDSTFVAAHRRL